MSDPLISVIIPTYNRPQALAECLESIYRQHYPNTQVIIVNDCGESVQSVRNLYTELDITIIDLPENRHHVAARNEGLAQVRGEFVMLCDDDDLLLPGHFRLMLAEMKHAELVYADAEIVEFVSGTLSREPISRRLFAYRHDYALMRTFSTFISSGCMFRASFIDQMGVFDVEMRNYWDWDFYLRAAQKFRVRRSPVASVLYAFSSQGGNQSNQLDNMRPYLDRLSAKHGLGDLPTKNFFLLLEEPEMKQREAPSQLIWDGQPIVSRWNPSTLESPK